VAVEVDVVGDGHTTVCHAELLDLEEGHVEGTRGGRKGAEGVGSPRGLELARDLNLLGQGVRGKRDREAIRRRRAPDGHYDVSGEQRGWRRGRGLDRAVFRATEVQEGLGLVLSANHTKVRCEELSTRHEILTCVSSLYFHIEPDYFFWNHLELSVPSSTIPYSLSGSSVSDIAILRCFHGRFPIMFVITPYPSLPEVSSALSN
jgi:hypothetical protein